MQVKVYRAALVPAITNAFQQEDNDDFAFEINLENTFYFTSFTPERHHYDNCQFYNKTGLGAREVEMEDWGVFDLLDGKHSRAPISVTWDANTKPA